MPHEIVDLIQDTAKEIKDSVERIDLLKKELLKEVKPPNKTKNVRDFLRDLAERYGGEGGIRGDVVYAAAFKSLSVDVALKRKTSANSNGGESAKKKRKRTKKKDEKGNNDIGKQSEIRNDIKSNVRTSKITGNSTKTLGGKNLSKTLKQNQGVPEAKSKSGSGSNHSEQAKKTPLAINQTNALDVRKITIPKVSHDQIKQTKNVGNKLSTSETSSVKLNAPAKVPHACNNETGTTPRDQNLKK